MASSMPSFSPTDNGHVSVAVWVETFFPENPSSRSCRFQIARRHRRVGWRPPGADGNGE